jgi:hypothetical protein
MPGYVEIAGRLQNGNEVVLMPPELCCEPRGDVGATLEGILRTAGMPVVETRVSYHSRNASVH